MKIINGFFNKMINKELNIKLKSSSLKIMVWFFAVIFVFTVVSRGTQGAKMAKVEIALPFAGEIVNSQYINATVSAVTKFEFTLPIDIAIKQILVVLGQNVEIGDVVALLDSDDVQDKYTEYQINLKELNLQLNKLRNVKGYDDTLLIQAKHDKDLAEQDLINAQTEGKAKIEALQQVVDSAIIKLLEAEDKLEKVMSDLNSTEQDKTLAKQEVENAESACLKAKSDLNLMKESTNENNQNKDRLVKTAIQALDRAEKSDEQARSDYNYAKAQNELEIQKLLLKIKLAEEDLEAFEHIKDGEVKSLVKGIVSSVSTQKKTTLDCPIVTISDMNGFVNATGAVLAEDAAKLDLGAVASISKTSNDFEERQLGNATLISISPENTQGKVNVTFSLPQGAWKQNESIDLELILKREVYPICIPVTALKQNQNGYFVFAVIQTSTVLGIENIVEAIPVKLIAKNESVVAVSGLINSDSNLVVFSNKVIVEGDNVRVRQK